MEILRTLMNFKRVIINILHDVTIAPNPYPYTAKFVFVGS